MTTSEIFQHLDDCKAKATAKSGHAVRITAGYYVIKVDAGLLEIRYIHSDVGSWTGWIAVDWYNNYLSSTVFTTLYECVDYVRSLQNKLG